MNNTEMKKMVVYASVFTVISMAVMFHRAATKHISITDASSGYVNRATGESSFNLVIDKNVSGQESGKLIIPLSKSVKSDNISLEERYADHELLIYVDSREEGFYLGNAIKTDLDILESAVCTTEDGTGSVCLDFKFDALYASESTLTEDSTIEVTFSKPTDKYENIVVIDPAGDGDIPLGVAVELKNLADNSDASDTKFYFTRLDKSDPKDDKRLSLVEDSGADLVVKIDTDVSTDKSINGISTYYNGTYFLRNYNNAEFATLLEKNLGNATGSDLLGVYKADESDFLLQNSRIPAARVSVGYISGNKDFGKMTTDSYQKKLAEGIFKAIMDALAILDS